MTPDQQARHRCHEAAFQPAKRAAFVAALQADAELRKFAEQELQRLADGQKHGLLDRDHVSKVTHDMLVAALRQAQAEPGVSVE